jgi:putative glutathione S-transferase
MTTASTTGNTWTRQIDDSGAFVRHATGFHGTVSAQATSPHPVEPGRYHLYVSLACPWAHRTLIVRALKGLEDAISVDVVHPHLNELGWSFDMSFPGTTGDTVGGRSHLQFVYRQAAPDYDGIVTVPVLWDKKLGTIVNNESAEIIRMFNDDFQALASKPHVDLYPRALAPRIDETNAWVYRSINNGVYRSGFATTQLAHDAAADELFDALDRVEGILSNQDYLCGNVLTEADVRLFATLIRFDVVYHTHFKCNRRLIAQYPAMQRYTARIYNLPMVAETVDLDHIRSHYYGSHPHLNPSGIIPQGPDVLRQLAGAGV